MAITYTEKGVGLHAAVQSQGFWLQQIDGVWQAGQGTNQSAAIDTQVQAIINNYAAKAEKLAALLAKYNSIMAAGRIFTVSGGTTNTYQIDEIAPLGADLIPTRQASAIAIANAGGWAGNVVAGVTGVQPWPAGFSWSDASNTLVPMTAAQMYAFAQNVAMYLQAIRANRFSLRNQIAAATTFAQVSAIDLTAGWPSNP